MPKPQYEHYIKQYTGSELMECRIYGKINYLTVRPDVRNQIDLVVQHIEKLRKHNKDLTQEFPGLTIWQVKIYIFLSNVIDMKSLLTEYCFFSHTPLQTQNSVNIFLR